MNLDERLKAEGQRTTITPREEHIRATVAASRESFLRAEAARPLSRTAFLAAQLSLMHKRWWLAQALLLICAGQMLFTLHTPLLIARTLGVAAALFVLLLIPEFARNSATNAMEIEGTTHYTLRHVYAARLVLFGGGDLFILTIFCGVLSFSMQLSLVALVSQFLLPLVMTACLCFGILSGQRGSAELSAICACLFWSGIWWLVVTSERLYSIIAAPMWGALFVLCLLVLAMFVCRWLSTSTKQWEETHHGTLYE